MVLLLFILQINQRKPLYLKFKIYIVEMAIIKNREFFIRRKFRYGINSINIMILFIFFLNYGIFLVFLDRSSLALTKTGFNTQRHPCFLLVLRF